EPAWLARYGREIGQAAALYVGVTGDLADWGLPYAIGAKLGLMRTTRHDPLRHTLLDRFVAALRREVAREALA
ncbi:MAG TPA: hypothetical protein VGV90_05200, partial [Solirubrobacteraceae bacterium]|nr:hypothetical protein [Solirubrobacteraceae bacterium]